MVEPSAWDIWGRSYENSEFGRIYSLKYLGLHIILQIIEFNSNGKFEIV